MEDTFLDDQFHQMDKINTSYKEDITSLDGIVRSWEELPNRHVEELSDKIKTTIKNSTTIEIKEDEKGQLLLEMTFHPIKVAWLLKTSK